MGTDDAGAYQCSINTRPVTSKVVWLSVEGTLWVGCGLVVDRLWAGCGWVVGWLWIGCGLVVDRLWAGWLSGWLVSGLFRVYFLD